MKVAVKDANVLIDLVEGDLLGLWFRLGIETHVPDLVLAEIKHPEHRRMVLAMVEAGNLRVETFSPTQLTQIGSYKQRYRISLADASAILLAEVMQATLLSGDRLVRKGGQSLSIDVRGLLWVIDELVVRELLRTAEAAVRLERVVDAGAHLPAEQVQARLQRWRGS
jgi:predicted nucleic acid-binding protein